MPAREQHANLNLFEAFSVAWVGTSAAIEDNPVRCGWQFLQLLHAKETHCYIRGFLHAAAKKGDIASFQKYLCQ